MRRVIVGMLLLAAVLGGSYLYPQFPRITPVHGYVAAFTGDSLTFVTEYRVGWGLLPSRVRRVDQVDVGPGASVSTFDIHGKLYSGSLQAGVRINASEMSTIESVKLRSGASWYEAEMAGIVLDVWTDDGDRTLRLDTEAIMADGGERTLFRMELTNTSAATVLITDVQAPGIGCLSSQVEVAPGERAVLEFVNEAGYDWVRPWIVYRTASGDHAMPGASCYVLSR